MASPQRVRVRSYQVGFGDCFLVTFEYKTVERHVLIDFGSTGSPKKPRSLTGSLKKHMQRVADDIAATCGGKLEAVVATHRHKDHISGFDDERGPGATIHALNPEVVIQPWTEHPLADPQATGLTQLTAGEAAFAAGLRRMDEIAQGAVRMANEMRRRPGLRTAAGSAMVAELGFLGETNLANAAAVKNLMGMGKERKYLSYGQSSGITLSGVKVHVLGPPTLDQFSKVARQRSEDPDEFWLFRMAADVGLAGRNGPGIFPDFVSPSHDAATVWIRERLQHTSMEERLRIVRRMDSALNNTSVILLFEVGNQKLLFPGDAQIENWEWALKESPDAEENLELLRDVTVYKCGHHGSRNATPKTLWNNFSLRGPASLPGRLTTFISTAEGKHGHSHSNTEVPRETLVEAFQQNSTMLTTETVDPNGAQPFAEVTLVVE